MNLDNIKIGIFGGGVSKERSISLISAKEVYRSLLSQGKQVVLIDISTSREDKVKELVEKYKIDIAFIALHGEFGEDGGIQSIFERLGVCYTGSGPEASLLAMDKILAKNVFLKAGISTPAFSICVNAESFERNFQYPVVVKPYFSGSSLGVSIVHSKVEMQRALKSAFSFQNKIIVEDYIKGRELTVGILQEKSLGVVEIIAEGDYFDFTSKYENPQTKFIAPAGLSPVVYKHVQEVALWAHKALGCRHSSRVDIRLGDDNIPCVLEVNSIPGLTMHSLLPLSARVCGLTFDDLVLKMLEVALYEKKKVQKV